MGVLCVRMAKRSLPDTDVAESSSPAAKRVSIATLPPLDIGPACGEEDLSVKVLQVSSPPLPVCVCVCVCR